MAPGASCPMWVHVCLKQHICGCWYHGSSWLREENLLHLNVFVLNAQSSLMQAEDYSPWCNNHKPCSAAVQQLGGGCGVWNKEPPSEVCWAFALVLSTLCLSWRSVSCCRHHPACGQGGWHSVGGAGRGASPVGL